MPTKWFNKTGLFQMTTDNINLLESETDCLFMKPKITVYRSVVM